MSDGITWSYDGSAIARTSTLSAVWTVIDWDLSPFTVKTDHREIQLIDAALPQGDAHPEIKRKWSVVIKADVSALSGAVEAKLAAGWHELAQVFEPTNGEKKLQATYDDTGGTPVSRHLIVNINQIDEFKIRQGSPTGTTKSGGYTGEGGYIIFRVEGHTLFPYWIGATLLTLDTGAAAAQLLISGAGADTVTINNPGDRWCGLKIEFGSSGGGSVSSLTVANGANGDSLALVDSGPFADTDEFDWFCTDPRKVTRATTDTHPGLGSKIRIEPGDNTLTGTRVAGTGATTLTLSWPYLTKTLGAGTP